MTEEQQTPPSAREKSLEKSTAFIMSQHLWLKILIGMILGVAAGFTIAPDGMALIAPEHAAIWAEWIRLPGIIFLGLIQMVIVPLIICSIILGIAESGNLATVREIGLRIVPYFILTTALAITIGITLVTLINPGAIMEPSVVEAALESGAEQGRIPATTFDDLTIPQRIANIIPTNPAKAQVDRDMLQIVIAAILAGIALLGVPRSAGRPLLDLCLAGQVVSMKIISWAMVIAPYAVFGLLFHVTVNMGLAAFASVGLYMATVLLGLACMIVVYWLIFAALSGQKLGHFITGIREVQLFAFSTSSSAATMPFSIQAAEEKLGIRPKISRFVIPLGATINMDGTAMYQAIAALFLCQVFGIELSMGETILLLLTTIGASIGTPATPGVGLVVLATILLGIGVPPEGIALIIGVDRLLDMCRTTVNVTGDLTASAVMDRWVK